jgi:DNA-binding transcriptional ArsR family regulator
MLDGPLSTSELARRAGLSIGSVSRHPAVLRDAGLVASHRRGHASVHEPTGLGLSLLEADGAAEAVAAR